MTRRTYIIDIDGTILPQNTSDPVAQWRGECRGKSIPGADQMLGWGGRVACPDWPVQHSTSDLILRIRRGDDLQPWPQLQTLAIDGAEVVPCPRFSVTWVSAPDGPRPVLYSSGRRVTAPWSIELVHDQPKDPFGSSA